MKRSPSLRRSPFVIGGLGAGLVAGLAGGAGGAGAVAERHRAGQVHPDRDGPLAGFLHRDADARGDRLGPADGRVETVEPAEPGPAMLVRPDGYIAWAGDPAGAADALARWCGSGAAVPR